MGSTHLPYRIFRNNYWPIVEGGLIAGGTSDRRGRQACIFSAMNPLEEPLRDFIELRTDEPQMVHYELDMQIAQHRGLTVLSNRQRCDYSVQHHAIRSVDKICESSPTIRRQKSYSIQDPRKPHKFHAVTVLFEQEKTHCNHVWSRRDHTWKQHGETRCVTTVTKHESLVLISECKKNQII